MQINLVSIVIRLSLVVTEIYYTYGSI